MTPSLPRIIALVGSTGSGKTGLGIELARALETEIISVDSMAVYRGMDIGTAKPSLEERGGIPHHQIDVVDPDEPFSAADFVRLARPIIDRVHAAGRPILLVGGTGLYLRALIHGLFEGPAADPAFREQVIAEAASRAAAGEIDPLHRRLEQVDPAAAARLHPRDQLRIVRALEVFHLTGRPLTAWQTEHAFAERPYRWIKLALDIPRDELYRRIDARALAMVDHGLEDETRRLLERYGPDTKPMKGLGYLHFTRKLSGEWTLEEAIAAMQRDTRRFARRQITWFRGEAGVQWVAADPRALLETARKFVET
jgi:tRNA dimethylallyltransferase